MKKSSSPWLQLAPREFEELMFWVLYREGFWNVSWYGAHGSDSGRDIICQRCELLGPKVYVLDCVVQCKRYKGYVSLGLLWNDLLKAAEHKPSYFIIATTGLVSAKTKDAIDSKSKSIGVRTVLWERGDLEIMLARHPDLGLRYLRLEPDSSTLLKHVLAECSAKYAREHLVFSDDLAGVVVAAATTAMRAGQRLSTAHLLREIALQVPSLLERFGLDPARIHTMLSSVAIVEEVTNDQLREGLRMSHAVRVALDRTLSSLDVRRTQRVSLLSFAENLLANRQSGTVQFLREQCGDVISLLDRSDFTETRFQRLSFVTHLDIDRAKLYKEIAALRESASSKRSRDAGIQP